MKLTAPILVNYIICMALLLLCTFSHAQTVTYAQFGSTPSAVADDGSGNIGIGTATPVARLHVDGTAADPILKLSHTLNTPDFFVAESTTALPGFPPSFTTKTKFVINNQGHIGIGEVDPKAALDRPWA